MQGDIPDANQSFPPVTRTFTRVLGSFDNQVRETDLRHLTKRA
jgi:hypothetical protein